jgi:tetratricopeptide (TPR) repeat protein
MKQASHPPDAKAEPNAKEQAPRHDGLRGAFPFVAAPLFLAALGCAAAAPRPQALPTEIELPTTVVTPSSSARVDELLAQADAHAEAGRDEQALALYHQVITADESGIYRKQALFGLAFVHDRAGRFEQAADAYLRVVGLGALGEAQSDEARVRAVRLLLFLDRFQEADEVARPLDPAPRSAFEQAALRAARALGDLSRGQLEAAEEEIARGRASLDAAGFSQLVEVPLDVAALEYARGELLRIKASQIRFNPLPTDFAGVLERRCQLILDAQAAFSEAMKSKSAQYAAKSGVRVGELYQSLHTDLVGMAAPVAADTEQKRMLFEGALRLRYSILLTKAKAMMQSTVALIERTGEGGAWAERARDALAQIERADRVEQALIDALPVSRPELEAALAEIEARARAQRGPEG